MILSVVDSPDERGLSRDPGTGPRDRTKKRYNVAASRARNQLWVCHSLNADNLKASDLRRRLILHATNPESTEVRKQAAAERADSEFERRVQAFLIDAGYKVLPQHKVGSYRIDMLVTDGVRSLAVECDGDRFHTQETLEADVTRQMILERCGYRFERIRGTEFFRNPRAAMASVFARLEELQVGPASTSDAACPHDGENEVCLRVRARADELRASWRSSLGDFDGPGRAGKERDVRSSLESETRLGENKYRALSPAEKTACAEVPSTLGTASDEQSRSFPSNAPDGLLSQLSHRGLTFVDKRPVGGALWIVGGDEVASAIRHLSESGFRFRFVEAGGSATGHRPGWFLQSA